MNRICKGLGLQYRNRFVNNKYLDTAILQSKNYYKNLEQSFPNYNFNNIIDSKNPTKLLHKNITNFYSQKAIKPYIPIASCGPWIITSDNKIVYDVGGYGMLGLGHNNPKILNILSQPQTMANIMTPNFSHGILLDYLYKEIGSTRKDDLSYESFMYLNSGSEVNELAFRIADGHAKTISEGKENVIVTLKKSFHGRTYLPAQSSDSTNENYKEKLSTYSNFLKTYTISPNSLKEAKNVFNNIKESNEYPLLTLIEPVMGEGQTGKEITPNFYKLLRQLTNNHNSLLLVDSVQSGYRATGFLSIIDYEGYRHLPLPDMESFSKAITSGQFPVSALALKNNIYPEGTYGNTMTGNPRGQLVSSKIIDIMLEDDIKYNIKYQGEYLKDQFYELQKKYPKIIKKVSGKGLMLALFLYSKYDVANHVEYMIRREGLNVIKGSGNALRFTPWFLIDYKEIELIIDVLDNVFCDMEQNYDKDIKAIRKYYNT